MKKQKSTPPLLQRFIARLLIGGLAGLVLLSNAQAIEYNFSKPSDNLDAFVRVRGEATGKHDVVTWFSGTLYIVEPGKRPTPIMGFEGFNNTRTVPTSPGNYDLLVREVMYYTDLKTGKIIASWENPYTKKINHVIHVANDPVNHQLSIERANYNWINLGEDMHLRLDVPLAYPNPLQPDQYPEESSGAMYTGSEHFHFIFKRADLENEKLASVPINFAWFRSGPVLPWMKMGATQATLLYSGTGHKVPNGVAGLPSQMREYTEKHFPKYLQAPRAFTKPNETSWTYFKKIIDQQRATDTAQKTKYSTP